MTSLAILIPVLRRPHRVEPLVASIRENTPGTPRIFFICDKGDCGEIEAVQRAGQDHVELEGANYARKINVGVKCNPDFALYFFGADDLAFHPGWLEAATEKLTEGIGVVSTRDLCNARNAKGNLATHPLVTREYAELGAIDGGGPMHEGYPHEYVDQEFTETAMYRNAYAFAPDSVVEHLHPQVGKAPMDDLYAAQYERMRAGFRIYKSRRHLWM